MEFFLSVAVVACVIYFYYAHGKITRLEYENKKLKKQVASLQEALNQNGEVIVEEKAVQTAAMNANTQTPSKVQIPVKKELSEEEKQAIKLSKEKAERERRNTGILITGAVLIILAAIVFLMSAWNILGSIGKIIVLGLVCYVFFSASKMAKEKYGLEKASNTFYYIAMAYIPLLFLSCSIFGLLGEFLSITGPGNFIYLTLSMALTAGIYYIAYTKRQTKGLLYGSILAQTFAVILFALVFETSLVLIAILLLLYNILFMMLTSNNSKEFYYFYNGIFIAGALFGLLGIGNENVLYTAVIGLVAANGFMMYKLADKPFYAYIFNIALYYVGIHIIGLFEDKVSTDLLLILDTLYIVCVWIVENLVFALTDKKDLKVSNAIISLAGMTLLVLGNAGEDLLEFTNTTGFIRPYMIGIIELVMMYINYISSKETGKNILGVLFPLLLVFCEYSAIKCYEGIYYLYPLLAVITFALGEFIPKDETFKQLRRGFFIISNIYIVFTYVYCIAVYPEFRTNVIMYLILEIAYVYMYFRNKDFRLFKYLAYVTEMFLLDSLAAFFELPTDVALLVPFVTTIEVMFIERQIKELEDPASKVFTFILQIISMTAIGAIEDTNLKLVFLAGSSAGLTALSAMDRKADLNTISSGLYLVAASIFVENPYFKIFLYMIWSLVNAVFIEDAKVKDFFKGVFYVSSYFMYERIIKELELDEYTAFQFFGIIACAIALFKTILYKYIKELDKLEYITFGLIYFAALFTYNGEADGMLFGVLIVAVMILSYMRKYGAIFVISLAAIIVNALVLTRLFWLIIPWWIYLLVIGGVLISFGIKNESDEKRGIDVKGVIKNIKDKVEKE